jgi:AraC-like DNA-binding protein
MDYREHVPRPPLDRLIACIWTLEGHAEETGGAVQPVLPDGRPEILFHFGDPFERLLDDGRIDRQPPLIYAGQLTSALVLRPSGRIAVLGVRFHPDGVTPLIDAPQHELAGHTIAIDAVAPRLAGTLCEVLDAAASPAQALDHVQSRLVTLAARSRPDPRVRFVVDAIGRRRGQVSISALAGAIGSSPRQLERRFRDVVGVPPKRLARIARFQHALRVLESPDASGSAGTCAAATCGYADQAHFVRDFRDLAGCTPGAHLLNQAELTGLFRDRLG